jgi:hypothetical protein
MLAMQGSESGLETEFTTEQQTGTTRTEPPTRAELATEVKPLPYRLVLAKWPIEWRERWGRRANDLEEAGFSWRDAEGRAFVEVWNQLRVAHDVERN